ncbi:MAG: undecaprenyldiphospho-muramoylpentapeptide beta-N-acetylglucosaminyltransferase [bacterium]|nr:undecaprenyldiphospho-muramoylpentapeptide beta-N-acetylglucosaminyltransferase [bacterium]
MIKKKILIIGGGTGGHISPGIALYEEFKNKGVEVFFLTGTRDKRFSTLEEVSTDDLYYYSAPTLTKNIFKLPVFFVQFVLAIFKARKIMREQVISSVIGMGGYVSAPALIAAQMRGLTVYLCDQNSVPGKVTSFFEKYARKVYGTFEVSKEYMKFPEKLFYAGNPIRKQALQKGNKEAAKKAFNLEHSKKIILAIGGSQGALRINELMLGLKKQYPKEFKDIGTIWSTGSYSYEKFKDRVHNEIDGGSIYLSPYIEKVGLAYAACDIAISRSGAGVMMEEAAMGLPTIQVPYPHAAADHQDKNADAFEKAGAAIKIKDSEAVAEKVGPILFELLNNPREMKRMSEKALEIAKGDASQVIVDDIMTDKL